MLEKPDIPDELITSSLQEEYGLYAVRLTFLPIGADPGTAVYRIDTDDAAYFLKLRKGFEEITVTVPLFLKSQGIQGIIAPVETKSERGWTDFGEHTMILYPFIEGQDGFNRLLTEEHRRSLGAALQGIHTVQIPPGLKKLLPAETFSAQWREKLESLQAWVARSAHENLTAKELAGFMRSRGREISHLIERSEGLALELRSHPEEVVLCHTDLHGGNILISEDDRLYIVDWDNPLLAPRERDLMFIGGGVDGIWKTEREEAIFYEGYGKTDIDLKALAYYRYERIIEDLAVIGEQLLFTGEGGEDRKQALGWFMSNFEPGGTLEIARKTDRLLE